MTAAAAKTGTGPTVTIAIEQYFPTSKLIVEDDLAYAILPPGMQLFVRLMRFNFLRNWMIRAAEKSAPGIWGGLLCRKRYIDDQVIKASSKVGAYVNLGAGLDTRLYRLSNLVAKKIWEVDQKENIKLKESRFQKQLGQIPSHIKLASIDFDHDDLQTTLEAQGYSLDLQTFFIWEAVTQYLAEDGIKTTLNFLAKAAKGSLLVFTYVLKDFIDGQVMYDQNNLYRQYVEKNIWLFGINPETLPEFLDPYGWRVLEHLGYDELAKQYIEPTDRELASTPIERVVFAEKI